MQLQNSKPQSQTPNLLIEDAVPTDAEAIAKIGATTFATSFGYSMPAEDVKAYLEEAYTPTAISKDLANRQNHFFVARLKSGNEAENGKVVGFLQMKLGTTEPCLPPGVPMCEINRIYVSMDHVGGGTGQLLMERGLVWTRNRLLGSGSKEGDGVVDGGNGGTKERKVGVWLGVWEENVKAQRFYRRWGFEKVGSHEFTMGGTTQTDFVMVKWL